MATINNVFNLEPIYIELMKEDGETLKKRDELFQESYDALESMFNRIKTVCKYVIRRVYLSRTI